MEVNNITTLFPKDAKGIINWFNKGLATNIDKIKALQFIEALPNHPGTTINNEELLSAAKVVNNFDSPQQSSEENLFRLKNGTFIKSGSYFSGGGLLEEGLKKYLDPSVAVEFNEKISGVYADNFGNHIVTADVRDVDPRELAKHVDGEVQYLHKLGCGFSLALHFAPYGREVRLRLGKAK